MTLACSWCQQPNDKHQGVNTDDTPSEGAVSLCWHCRHPSVFTSDGKLRKPSAGEHAELMQDPEVKRAVYAMSEANKPMEAMRMFREISGNA